MEAGSGCPPPFQTAAYEHLLQRPLCLTGHLRPGLATYRRTHQDRSIAKRQGIPQKFLELILASLKQGGFVESHRGARGGYQLARLPETITVDEVLRFVDGTPQKKKPPGARLHSANCGEE